MAFRGYVRAQPDWRRVSFLAAPWLEWGAVDGTVGGELLQVQYTVTQPEVVAARLVLADGRELEMVVYPDRLEVLLPADVPDGPATVIAELDDGAGRTATAELVVFLTGVPIVKPVPAPGGRTPPRPQLLVRATPARVRVNAGSTGLARRERATTVRLAGAARVLIAPVQRVLARSPGTVRVSDGPGVVRAVVRTGGATLALQVGETAVAHRDGPALEEALLLDLL